ncbi:TetR/AcrR family transcriptional regulator [Mucilaginibacter arboris]|uniref:TetR family transcriptional regulator n=1 Tax=Mucilaginibacter arboris TaxID=2682090 RepID=A0A7K1SS26_9SPHI|nr:TetR/AcrR family transcriptional regulator [Mucilaginibacter arboris]MVN20115.1 TetR family transcriptional regulator [Mucilaginibacter arboris]
MEKEKTDKKDHILDVAEKVFSELGYDGASTRLISGEANVNMAMLNYYFGSKEGLFIAVFERKINLFRTLLQNINEDESLSSWNKLELYIDKYVDRVVANSCFQKLVNREVSLSRHAEINEKITDILMTNVLEFKKVMQEGVDNGSFFEGADIGLCIATIFGTKNYIINTPQVASRMLGKDVLDENFLESELKPRMKIYMKKLLKSYLATEK